MSLFRQYNLKSGTERLTAWLQDGLKKGFRVTLKDIENPLQWWTVTSMGDTTLPKNEIKGAHNSKDWHKKDYHGKLKGLDIK